MLHFLILILLSVTAHASPSDAPIKENPLLIRPPQLNYAALCGQKDAGQYSTKEIADFLAQEKEGRFNGQTYLALSHIYAGGLGTAFQDTQKAEYYAHYAAQHPFAGQQEAIAHLARLRLTRAKKGDSEAITLLTRENIQLQQHNAALAGFITGELATLAGNQEAVLAAYRSVAGKNPRAALALAQHYRADTSNTSASKSADEMIALAQNLLLGEINQGKCGALLTLADIFLTPSLMTPQPDIGMAWLKTALEAGYPQAGIQLGHYYAKGEFTEKDSSLARTWWEQAASQGSKRAMHLLAKLALEDAAAAADENARKTALASAFAQAEKAAQLNYMPSILLMISLHEGKYGQNFYDTYKAEEWEKRALQAPHPPAALLRKQGLSYRFKEGKNAEKSITLLKAAAEQGELSAWQDIADSYRFGWGVPQAPEQSFSYTKKGALAGSAVSAYQLAEHYHCGIGTKKDPVSALQWLNEAITGGNLQAVFTWQAYNPEKGNVFTKGDVSSIYAYDRYIRGTDEEKSKTRLQFLERAADNGSSKAMTLLALHARATGNEAKAAQLITQAQTTGDNPADSLLVLGTTVLDRRKDTHARTIAKEYFQQAIRLGSHNAAIALARLHLTEHQLTKRDIERLEQASTHQVREAALLLGDIYLRAEWYDRARAITILRHAALLGSQSAMLRLATLEDESWREKAQRAVLCDENSLLDAGYYMLARKQLANATPYFADAMKRGSPKAIRHSLEIALILHALGDAPAPHKMENQWQLAAELGDKTAQHTLPLFQTLSHK
jgi:TPR repeat protein